MAEQFGIRPEGHPWLKMVRYHKNFRGVPDLFGNDYTKDIPGNYDYYQVAGMISMKWRWDRCMPA